MRIAIIVATGAVAAGVAGAAGTRAASPPDPGAVQRRLVGTWRLVSFVQIDPAGHVIGRPYGAHPFGRLTYTSDGRVWALTEASGPPGSERGGNWYTGTYTVDARRTLVLHRVESSSIRAWEGTTLRRTYHFDGARRLTLTAPLEGSDQRLVLRWRR